MKIKSSNKRDVILATGADVLTVLTSTELFMNRFYDPIPIWGKILLTFVWHLLLILFTLWLLRSIIRWFLERKCKKYGTHGIPCKVEYLYNYKVLNRNKRILLRLHKYTYHNTYIIKREIETHRLSDKKEVKEFVRQLVSVFQESLSLIFNLDMTIGIKLITSSGRRNVLQTYLLIPSKDEVERDNRKVLDDYLLKRIDSDDITDYAKEVSKFTTQRLPQNSAFNYVLSSNKTYWMSNDLRIDEKEGVFMTTSKNYKKYYNSMAVFAICPPCFDGEAKVTMRGVLTFDTLETGQFCENECKFLMGYLAHCLYEILKDLK